MASNEIMRMRYRIGKERSYEIIATRKICEKKKTELLAEYNGDIKISKIVIASNHPHGAPHI
jgi:hypothetical protein